MAGIAAWRGGEGIVCLIDDGLSHRKLRLTQFADAYGNVAILYFSEAMLSSGDGEEAIQRIIPDMWTRPSDASEADHAHHFLPSSEYAIGCGLLGWRDGGVKPLSLHYYESQLHLKLENHLSVPGCDRKLITDLEKSWEFSGPNITAEEIVLGSLNSWASEGGPLWEVSHVNLMWKDGKWALEATDRFKFERPQPAISELPTSYRPLPRQRPVVGESSPALVAKFVSRTFVDLDLDALRLAFTAITEQRLEAIARVQQSQQLSAQDKLILLDHVGELERIASEALDIAICSQNLPVAQARIATWWGNFFEGFEESRRLILDPRSMGHLVIPASLSVACAFVGGLVGGGIGATIGAGVAAIMTGKKKAGEVVEGITDKMDGKT
ncbi:hypothetical protein [Sphingobium yanoikuyae]|uniref:hypothetical protein n=1 Tax=Sphingobium yanoikuyae TaxID=13690 RepID=UPI0004969096|nr:hypothetical protein [Sphingobium yanoikuyae]